MSVMADDFYVARCLQPGCHWEGPERTGLVEAEADVIDHNRSAHGGRPIFREFDPGRDR